MKKFFQGTTFRDIWPVLKWVIIGALIWFALGKIIGLFKKLTNPSQAEIQTAQDKKYAFDTWTAAGYDNNTATSKAVDYSSDMNRLSFTTQLTSIPLFGGIFGVFRDMALNSVLNDLPPGSTVPSPESGIPSNKVTDQVLDPSFN